MKIILVATGATGKNLVFVSDALRAYTVEEMVRLAKEGKLKNLYAVNAQSGVYLRTKRSTPKKEQLEQLAVSSRQLFAAAQDIRHAQSTPAFSRYLQLYEYSLQKNGGPLVIIEGKAKITKEAARAKLTPHKDYIFAAAKRFNIDPYLLGAIIIDEIARIKPFEDVGETLLVFFVGKNASGGVAQVKVETARGLIKDGYYNPDPNDPKLARDTIAKTPRLHLYTYVKEPRHSIFFAAARMRALTDTWKKFVDLSRKPEIIATLYHLSYKGPHRNPEANPRGVQITNEFYPLAKKWLR